MLVNHFISFLTLDQISFFIPLPVLEGHTYFEENSLNISATFQPFDVKGF